MKLKILGKVSKSTINTLNLDDFICEKNFILFADYSEYEISKFQNFDLIVDIKNKHYNCNAELIHITQQYGRVFEIIPKGWKTIIIIKVEGQIPSILQDLSEQDSWGNSDESLELVLS